ncbi:hypothetical protein [Cyclobacterium marinum]|uniref:Right handed beta helix domain-containing protein n=1 Tax=Cyclobacterium marinum (strain ATCC 25205 / DSM 745 / LMG 13164 / NCIMB 1802) TaxID=880070 RepID=G0J3H7_CYCMS|nr:hypothetical protein [Cyclobacterium marinum]AEL24616.1 hypothetical protein Cycma_0843 [Cyclobacterium marinum DSM 745]
MKSFSFITLFLLLNFLNDGYCQSPGEYAPNPYAVPTYECASLYWTTPEAGMCIVKYKKASGSNWTQGLDLVFDDRDGQYRGSIVGLSPDTEYLVELSNGQAKTAINFTTRTDQFPIGKITYLPEGESTDPIIITESGTPEGYHLITVPENSRSVLNMGNVSNEGIQIDADYVIVREIEIRNAKVDGIRIKENRHDIVIEQCFITFWGRIGGPITYGNLEGSTDSGIKAENGTRNLTIQRNLIEAPRGASNDWETGHPAGPQGITISQSLGGNVIRYNDILSTEDHGFNDAIGGGSNYSNVGNMNRDSDIYGNLIRSVWDDAIEVEGANMNVRVFANYAHQFFNGIATASTTKGPIYIYRNVVGESRVGHRNSSGGAFIKTGEREPFAGGRRYVFHNTVVQPMGVSHAFSGHGISNTVTRNNIFDVPGRLAADRETVDNSDYDCDYFSGLSLGVAKEKNRIKFSTTPSATRLYQTSYSLEYFPRTWINSIIWGRKPYQFGDVKRNITDPVVQIRNPLIDSGIKIPGFNTDFKGEAPDLGAFEVGTAPLEFGRRAYLAHDEGWPAWER